MKSFIECAVRNSIFVSHIGIRHVIVFFVNLWHENGQRSPTVLFRSHRTLFALDSLHTHNIFDFINVYAKETLSEQVLLNFSYRVSVLFHCGVRFTLYREN